jgi:hypothetical protein
MSVRKIHVFLGKVKAHLRRSRTKCENPATKVFFLIPGKSLSAKRNASAKVMRWLARRTAARVGAWDQSTGRHHLRLVKPI